MSYHRGVGGMKLIVLGEEGQAYPDKVESYQRYERLDGCTGGMRKAELCRYRRSKDVQRG